MNSGLAKVCENLKKTEIMSVKKPKQSEGVESDKQFLERSGATTLIRDALAKVIENRPKDPVSFLVNYFQSFDGSTDLTMKTYQQLTLTHYSAPSFEINVKIAFDMYSGNKVLGKNIRGVTGSTFMELLKLITRSYPVAVKELLLQKLHCYDEEAIRFPVFKYGVFVCFVMQDYLDHSRQLFNYLDPHKTGRVNKSLCDAIVRYLHRVISITSDSPHSILEAGNMLRPDNVAGDIMQSMTSKRTVCAVNQTSCEEFLVQVAQSFVDMVWISR